MAIDGKSASPPAFSGAFCQKMNRFCGRSIEIRAKLRKIASTCPTERRSRFDYLMGICLIYLLSLFGFRGCFLGVF
jgi:hypothetical protein